MRVKNSIFQRDRLEKSDATLYFIRAAEIY